MKSVRLGPTVLAVPGSALSGKGQTTQLGPRRRPVSSGHSRQLSLNAPFRQERQIHSGDSRRGNSLKVKASGVAQPPSSSERAGVTSATLPTKRVGDTKLETDVEELGGILRELSARKKEWAASSFAERRKLALAMLPLLRDENETVSKLAVQYKGSYETNLGEEMLYWVIGINFMADAAETLKKLDAGEAPITRLKSLGPKASEGIIDIFPMHPFDAFIMPGSRGQLYLNSGDTVPISGRTALERHGGAGECCLILGAGNIPSSNVSDVVNKVLLEGCVAVLKLNPVNEYTGPTIERALAPLIARGVLKVVYGGGAVGKALVESEAVDTIHMTGSDKTYDGIVWQGKEKTGEPPLKKPVSAELGCVSPVVVVPGVWSELDLKVKAAEICRNVATNASCNCLANKVVVTSASWPQREQFLEQLRKAFREADNRFVYYPGSAAKLAAFRTAYPAADAIHKGDALPEGCSPFVFASGLNPDGAEFAFREEPWSTVLSEVPLKAETVPEFLEAATAFCNDKLWGTLSATLMIHPKEERRYAEALATFLRKVRYGTVAVNTITGLAFTMPAATWGAFPGHTPADIQSGVGVVRNSLLIENVEKTVCWGRWSSSWMTTLINFEALCRGLNQFYGDVKANGMPKLLNLVRFLLGLTIGRFI